MGVTLPPRGLYAVTSEALCESEDRLCTGVQSAIRGGAVLVQYRDKRNDVPQRVRNLRALQAVCEPARVPLILNDGPVSLVLSLSVAGLHLGQTDGDWSDARRACPRQILGATCGRSLGAAQSAVAAGADYVAFGAFYPSTSKPTALPASLPLLHEARRLLRAPICAIGGITVDNAAPLIDAGADYIAVIGGLFGTSDIEATARRFTQLFKRSR